MLQIYTFSANTQGYTMDIGNDKMQWKMHVIRHHAKKVASNNFQLAYLIIEEANYNASPAILVKWRIPFAITQLNVMSAIRCSIRAIARMDYEDIPCVVETSYDIGDCISMFLRDTKRLYINSLFGYTDKEMQGMWSILERELKSKIHALNTEFGIDYNVRNKVQILKRKRTTDRLINLSKKRSYGSKSNARSSSNILESIPG